MNPIKLIRELRRRKVFRGAAYYLIGAWGVLQVGDVVIEPAGLPAWTLTALLFLAAAGLPLALFIAWRYDISDEGIVRTRALAGDDAETAALSLKASDYLIVSALLLIVAFAVWQAFPDISENAEPAAGIETATRHPLADSIAVLPFSDISQNRDQRYLGEGISDTVMHVLSRVRGLTVSARTSSFAFRDRNMTIAEIASELNVAHVLEGSVQRAGDQLRIIARLIEARNGTELWSGYFDRELRSLFEIQDEIAREVVAAMKVTVMDEDREKIEERYQPDLEAYEKLILGRTEMDKGTLKGRERAQAYFEAAIERDPDYAAPYVDLAMIWMVRGASGLVAREVSVEKRRALISKALDLDPTSAGAHVGLGFLQRDEGDIAASTQSFRRAIELNPNHAEAYAALGSNLFRAGRFEESLEMHQKAVELNPRSNQFRIFLANAYWSVARAEEAVAMIRENIRMNPANPGNYAMMIRWLNQLARPGESMLYAKAARRADPANPVFWWQECQTMYQLWDFEAAEQCMAAYVDAHPADLDARKTHAGIRGDLDEAIRLSEQHVEAEPGSKYRRTQWAYWLSVAGRWESVIDVLAPVWPELLREEPVVDDWSIWPARHLAQALIETGQRDRAVPIMEAALATIERRRKMQGAAWVVGIEDAQFHALLGNRAEALRRLESAIQSGWTYYSSSLLTDPVFASFRTDPAWQALLAQLESNMEAHRAWHEKHKDDLVL